jgi:hypothetical protein
MDIFHSPRHKVGNNKLTFFKNNVHVEWLNNFSGSKNMFHFWDNENRYFIYDLIALFIEVSAEQALVGY